MMEMTLEELFRQGKASLERAGIQEARLDAWLLLEYVTGKNRAYYFAHQEEKVHEKQICIYEDMIRRRSGHIPLQQLTHQAFFMGHEFYVDENVLIPRQDTEVLVEEALNILKNTENPQILDMCTGSGCILISLLLEITGACGCGVDLSEKALQVAEKNSEKLHIKDKAYFVKSDLFSAVDSACKCGKIKPVFDMIISNPPYIPTEEIETLMEEVRLHDPYMALDGREDGLYFYRAITKEAMKHMTPAGWLLYETGSSQGKDVKAIMEQAGFIDIQIRQDLAGLDRVVLGQKPI